MLLTNGSGTITINIYKDKNDERYFHCNDKIKINLKIFKVGHLRDHIYNIKKIDNKYEIKLWKVNNIDKDRIENDFTEHDIAQKLKGQEMQNNNLFNKYFKDELANHNKIEMENIHIIVMIPATTAVLEGKVRDISGQFMKKLSMRPRITLPEVERLKDFIDEELPEDMKIPLTQREFDTLISDDLIDLYGPDHLGILFRVSETESALKLCFSMLAAPIFYKTPPTDGTEYSFVGFWDSNIRSPLEYLIPNCKSIRNSNKRTSTGDDRPDYALILENHLEGRRNH
ncbi:hypothetical protein RclHR1_00580029 [Rhizophagus clarus]|uniref:Crinkler effector protein N-terminal domain-containing protein n=1 Tax=Rhizophagus clarus TaxID=94130 RepID=A0A2Z6RPY9_9GLOM|nr:hypothetical protein RclHR1_00580029 [Rhizophagus clarus]